MWTPPALQASAPAIARLSGVVAVAAGRAHTCALTESGGVLCWGDNDQGQLGTGDRIERTVPVAVPGLSGVRQIAAGDQHTCAALDTGALQCWGDGSAGQLGDGSTADSLAPHAVPGLNGVLAIAAGRLHTCARTAAGAVWCWGDNLYGQVGNDTEAARWLTPQPVTGLTAHVSDLAAGGDHSCAVQGSGVVFCWGRNESGQLGNTQHGAGEAERLPQNVANGFDVAQVAAGGRHSCAVQLDGALLCWGAGEAGQQGNDAQSLRASAGLVAGFSSGGADVALGEAFSCARTTAGAVRCWGSNARGQLAAGSEPMRLTPTAVPSLPGPILDLAAGESHTCAVTQTRELLCWGANDAGQLGTGDTDDRSAPAFVLQPLACYALALAHTGDGLDPVAQPSHSFDCAEGAFHAGEPVALAASPAAGWAVAGWSGTDDDASTGLANGIKMPAGPAQVVVAYEVDAQGAYLPAVRRGE